MPSVPDVYVNVYVNVGKYRIWDTFGWFFLVNFSKFYQCHGSPLGFKELTSGCSWQMKGLVVGIPQVTGMLGGWSQELTYLKGSWEEVSFFLGIYYIVLLEKIALKTNTFHTIRKTKSKQEVFHQTSFPFFWLKTNGWFRPPKSPHAAEGSVGCQRASRIGGSVEAVGET